jgi:hypothetical protein
MIKIEYIENEDDPRDDGWWIVDPDGQRTGPYWTRAEAVRWERETRSEQTMNVAA